MQYLLSEEEYRALVQDNEHRITITETKLQALCTDICNKMPVHWKGWTSEKLVKPWGCMLTRESKGEEWYCDSCPVTVLCPAQQHYSQ